MNAGPSLPGGPLLQRAEVDVEPDDGEVGVQARSDVDGLVEDAHGGSDSSHAVIVVPCDYFIPSEREGPSGEWLERNGKVPAVAYASSVTCRATVVRRPNAVLHPLRDRRRGRRFPRPKVERRPMIQHVQLEPDQAHRVVLPHVRHRAELQVRRIHDRERPAAHHLERVVRRR